jgi:pyruvate formate lyase activating enzyme
MARKAALDTRLRFPYVANVPGHEGENTYCPHCQNIVIRRAGLSIQENRLKDNTFKDGNQSIQGYGLKGVDGFASFNPPYMLLTV